MTARRVSSARLRALPRIEPAQDDSLDGGLMDAAKEALGNAYAPYSRFQVGAAVRSASGRIYAGVNMENAAYPSGTCAEQSALAAAVAAEGPRFRLVAVAVAAQSGGQARPCSPCGACRQRIAEFNGRAEVSFLGEDLVRVDTTADVLLPYQFRLDAGDDSAGG